MRFVFKTSYAQGPTLFGDSVQRNWYVALLVGLLALPKLCLPTYLSDISLVLIYGLCGISLMALAGYTGLVSLGHAAFLGIGAYAHVYFLQHGVPWVLSVTLAVILTTASGIVVGLPALRMTGIYLTIATLAFAVIIQEVFSRWESVTHGFAGMPVEKPVIFGVSFHDEASSTISACSSWCVVLWLTRNLLRSPTGRAWIAIRDSEIAAQSMGVQPGDLQVDGLRLFGGADGLGRRAVRAQDRLSGARHLHHPAVDPVLLLVIVGGLGSLHGAVFGAIFVALLPAADRHPARFDARLVAAGSPVRRHRTPFAAPRASIASSSSPASRPASSA